MKRRSFLTLSTAAATAPLVCGGTSLAVEAQAKVAPRRPAVRFCLNTSTLRGQKLTVPEQVSVAAQAGYDAIEPWMGDLRKFVESGGNLDDLGKQIVDAGLTVESAIGFAQWIVDDPQQRRAGLEEARQDMAMLRRIGGIRIAAPPTGAHRPGSDRPDLLTIAQRYHDLLEVGRQQGVVPQLELWGFSPTLSRLGELAFVAAEASHPDACVLPDFYHIYKGGSDFAGLAMIEAQRMHVFHINDYPADPPRDSITDAARVYPGDGVCPLTETIAGLIGNGFAGCFSLELFNPQYWAQDALLVAKTGLEKIKQVMPA